MGAPCKARLSGSSTKSDLSEDSYCMLIITGLINARARVRLLARDRIIFHRRGFPDVG